MNDKGSVSSGEKKEFSFKFRSDMPGTFMENWELIVAPKLPVQLKPLQVKGVALVDDKNRSNDSASFSITTLATTL